MDEEMIKDLFLRAKSKKYPGDINTFKKLLIDDPAALEDNFNYAKSKKYPGDIDGFSTLVGVKKKEETLSNDSEIPAEVLPKNGEDNKDKFGINSSVLIDINKQIESQKYESEFQFLQRKSISDEKEKAELGAIENDIANNYEELKSLDKETVKKSIKEKVYKATRDNSLAEKASLYFDKLKDDERVINTEVEPTNIPEQYQQVFNNINLQINKELLGEKAASEIEPDLVSKDKIYNDYVSYLGGKNDDAVADFKEGRYSKGDERGYNFYTNALDHQYRLLEVKFDSGKIDEETYAYVKGDLNKKYTGLIQSDKRFSEWANSLENIGFYEYANEVKSIEQRQQKLDADYEQSLKDVSDFSNPEKQQLAAGNIVLQNVVKPFFHGAAKFGVGVLASTARLTSLGKPADISREINNAVDSFDELFKQEGSVYQAPTRLKGELFGEDGLDGEKVVPKVTEMIAGLLPLLTGAGEVELGLRGLGMGSKLSHKGGLFISTFLSSQNDHYQAFKQTQPTQDNETAMQYSLVSAGGSGLVMTINPLERFAKPTVNINSIARDLSKKEVTKKAVSDIAKSQLENVRFIVTGDVVKNFTNASTNYLSGSDLSTSTNIKELGEEIIVGGIGFGLLGMGKLKGGNKIKSESLHLASSDIAGFETILKSEKIQNQYSSEKIDDIRSSVKAYKEFYDALPNKYSEKQKQDLSSALVEKRELDKIKETKSKLPGELVVEDIKEIEKEQEIINNEIIVIAEGLEVVKKEGKEVQVEETKKDKSEVERLRQEEQAELLEAIPDAKNYLTDGKVDKEKITNPEDITKFEEIYNKYDKVISPLLGNKKTEPVKEKQIIGYTSDADGNAVPVLAPIAESPTGKKYDAKDTKVEKTDTKDNPVSEPENYAKAVDEYKQTDLGGGKDAKGKKDKVIEESKTEEGKAYVKNEVSQLERNDDGTITLYRSGTIQDGHNPATTNKQTAELIAQERKKQGLSSDIVEVRVKPEDISTVIKGVEGEVFIEVNENNKSRISENTKEKQKTKKELLSDRDAVKKELEEVESALELTNKAIEEGTDKMLPVITKNKPKLESKIKNLQWQLKKYDVKLEAEPAKQDTKTEWEEWSDNPEGWEGGKTFNSKKGNTAVEYEGEKMPENATKKSIRIYRKALESNTDKETAANMALANMKDTKWYEKLNESKAESFDAAFVTSLGGKPAKVPTIVSKKKQMKAIDAEIKSRKESGKKNPAWKDVSDADLDAQKEKIEKESKDIDKANEKIKAIDAEMKARKADAERNPTLERFNDSELALQKQKIKIKIEEMKDSNPFVRKTARTFLKEKIRNLAKGADIGSVEGQKKLRSAQREVAKYARQVLKGLGANAGERSKIEKKALKATGKNISEVIAEIDKLVETTIEKKRLSTIIDIEKLVTNSKELLKNKGEWKIAKVPTDIKHFVENFNIEDLSSKTAIEIASIHQGLKDIIKGGEAVVKSVERDVANKKNEAETEAFLTWHKESSIIAKEVKKEIKEVKSKLKNRANRDGESTEKLIKDLGVLERRQEEGFEAEVSGLDAINFELGQNKTIAIVDGKMFTSESGLKKFLDHNDADLNNVKIYLKKDLNNERSSRDKNRNTIKGLAKSLSVFLDPLYFAGNLQNNLSHLAKSSKAGRLMVEELSREMSLAEMDLDEQATRIKDLLDSDVADILSGNNRWGNNAVMKAASKAARLVKSRKILAKEGLSKKDSDTIRMLLNSDITLSNEVIIDLYADSKTVKGRAQLKRQLMTKAEYSNKVKNAVKIKVDAKAEAKIKADAKAEDIAERKALIEAADKKRPGAKAEAIAEAEQNAKERAEVRAEEKAEADALAQDVIDANAESEGLDIIDNYMNKKENAKLKKVADYLVDDFYKTLKDRYDHVLFDLTGLHFEDGIYYPLLRAVNLKDVSKVSSLTDGASGQTKTLKPLSGHLKQTYTNRSDLNLTIGALSKAKDYVNTMERSKQFIPIGKRINEIFNRNTLPEIINKIGEKRYKNIEDHLITIVTGKSPRIGANIDNKYTNIITGLLAFRTLAGKPGSIPKQLTSAARFTSAEDVSLVEFTETLSIKPTKLEMEVMSYIIKGPYTVNRFKGSGFDIEAARMARLDGGLSVEGGVKAVVKAGMLATSTGDIGGVLLGGVPYALAVYRKAIDAKMTHEQAKKHAYDRFRLVSNDTQQSKYDSQLSHMQRNAVGRLFSIYTTSQKQGFNKMMYSARMLAWNTGLTKAEQKNHAWNTFFFAGEGIFYASVAGEFAYTVYKYLAGEEDDEEKINRGMYDLGMDTGQALLSGSGYTGHILNTIISDVRGQGWKNGLSINDQIEVMTATGNALAAIWLEGKDFDDLTEIQKREFWRILGGDGFIKTWKNFGEYKDGTKNITQAIMNYDSEAEKLKKNENFPQVDIFYEFTHDGKKYTPKMDLTKKEQFDAAKADKKESTSGDTPLTDTQKKEANEAFKRNPNDPNSPLSKTQIYKQAKKNKKNDLGY